MSASIPTPFNAGGLTLTSDPLFNSNDNSDGGSFQTSGNVTNGVIKAGGGVPSDDPATSLVVQSGKCGHRMYFNTGPTSIDFTSTGEKRLFVYCMQANAANRRQMQTKANDGFTLKMFSGTGLSNIREWVLGGEDTDLMKRTGSFLYVVDPNAAGTKADVGTFDPSDVLRYGHYITQKNSVQNTYAWWFWSVVVLISTEKDSTDIPRIFGTTSAWDDLTDAVQGTTDFTGQNHLYVEQAGTIINLFCPVSIGNASLTSPSTTTFNDGGYTVISPQSNISNDPRFQLTNDSMRLYLDLRNNAADSATFSGTYVWGTEAPWDFNVSNLATVTLNSPVFTGMGDFTLGSSVAGAATFTLGGSSKVIINGANLNGSTINNDCDLQGSNITTLQNIDITGALDFDTAGTYTLTNCTINEITNSSGGNITVINDNSTITTNTGPNITLESPAATYTLQLPNIIDGSRFQIFNVTQGTELTNAIVSGGGGVDEAYTANTDYNDGDAGRYRVTYQNGVDAKEPIEGNFTFQAVTLTNSIPVNQVDQSTYISNNMDGSTMSEFTWDSGNIQVDITDTDNTTTIQRFGAWYFYFITTAIGIDEAFMGVTWNALNQVQVNSDIVDITLDNRKTNPLLLTGGRIFRTDSGAVIASTSNSIQIEYDPVYVIETDTSGLTSSESTILTQARDQAQIAAQNTQA